MGIDKLLGKIRRSFSSRIINTFGTYIAAKRYEDALAILTGAIGSEKDYEAAKSLYAEISERMSGAGSEGNVPHDQNYHDLLTDQAYRLAAQYAPKGGLGAPGAELFFHDWE
jgi:hypothetical protein